MSLDFDIKSPVYNYSGYGSAMDEFDDFDDSTHQDTNLKLLIYNELLNQLGIDSDQLDQILNAITKNKNMKFSFVHIANNSQILYFKDELGHITPIPLNKILE